MTGDDVRRVQQALVDAGYAASVDGIYGPATTETVKQFQQARGLAPDGIVGPATRAALGLA
jgi:peptidoglycan hydrolase-like protein with peptidoglycan-binding domain